MARAPLEDGGVQQRVADIRVEMRGDVGQQLPKQQGGDDRVQHARNGGVHHR
jgi:hypothetical protein